ncbi:E3 ubiquitin-protein ligase MARCHF3-like [Montipora capricornis]|uniref:E3 ubiquitin-protein ligase MARCHF3-like n=1 Tax=Montipora foliosa TaxID=591990 RepID=UPI0035F16A52
MADTEPILEKRHIVPAVEKRVSPIETNHSPDFHLDVKSLSSDDLLNTCRICRDETINESLVSPCHCSGTLGKCHVHCLEEWLSKANKNSCEICGYRYRTTRIPRSLKEWVTRGQGRRERRFLCGDFVCFLILSPLVIASSYLCAQGAWYYFFITDRWTGAGLVSLSVFLLCIFGFWLIVTVRFHHRCWLDWRDRNQVVKLVKSQMFQEGELENSGALSGTETAV